MKIAVVVPVRDGEDRVSLVVAACRRQTRPPDDLIVVDSGSRDRTAEVAAASGARVVTEPLPGSYRARNRGWRATDADVIAFTDVDCLPGPTWLADLVAPFEDPVVGGVGGSIVQAERRSSTQRWIVERRFLDQAFNFEHAPMPFFATANVAYRRTLLEELGGFEGSLLSGGDNDFSWRVLALTDERLVFRPAAEVRHDVGPHLRELTSRARRYAAGDLVLERRWVQWPALRPRSFWSRTERVWVLPLALVYRAWGRRPLSVPLIDATMALSAEWGRLRGRAERRRSSLPVVPYVPAAARAGRKPSPAGASSPPPPAVAGHGGANRKDNGAGAGASPRRGDGRRSPNGNGRRARPSERVPQLSGTSVRGRPTTGGDGGSDRP